MSSSVEALAVKYSTKLHVWKEAASAASALLQLKGIQMKQRKDFVCRWLTGLLLKNIYKVNLKDKSAYRILKFSYFHLQKQNLLQGIK